MAPRPRPLRAPGRAPRLVLGALVGLVLLGVAAARAAAEEALVLRLSGVGSEAKVTVERRRIVQRFVTVEPTATPERPTHAAPPPLPLAEPSRVAPTLVALPRVELPEEEPRAAEETFLQRSTRRAAMALPAAQGPRAFLAAAAFLVVLCLVGLAARMADVEDASLGKTTLLGFLFCGMVAITWSWSDMFARADRATVLIPIQLLAWVGCAAAILRCGLGRAFHLLAFVLVSSALVVFSAAVVLVSV